MITNREHSERGATMLAALSFSSVLAISMGSYVAVSFNTLERVDEQVVAAGELLEGENVLEETLYQVSTSNLADWTTEGTTASRTVTGIDLTQLAESLPIDFTETVEVTEPVEEEATISDVFTSLFSQLGLREVEESESEEEEVIDYDQIEMQLTGLDADSNQRTLSLTKQTLLDDGSIETRTLTATMSPIAPFQVAIATDSTIRFRRDGIIDSYDSSVGNYSADNRGHEAALSGGTISISRAQVSGYAAATNRTPSFGRRASLKGPDTDQRVNIDPTRIVPSPYQPNLDPTEASGVGSLYSGPNSTLGSSGSSEPRIYYASELNLRGRQTITVEGPTRLVVDGDINISDNAAIVVGQQGSLEIHVDGNVVIDGRGIVNQSEIPANVAIIGTNTALRSIIFRGENALHGAVFTPNSDFSTYGKQGTSDIYGAIVARRVVFDDATNFHFDVALRDAHFDGIEKAFAFDSE